MSESKQFFTNLEKGMLCFRRSLTFIVNTILLLIVYFIGIGITSIIAKLLGKHFLETKSSDKKETYWSDLDLKTKPIENYYRQF